jgi:hypothetical protein
MTSHSNIIWSIYWGRNEQYAPWKSPMVVLGAVFSGYRTRVRLVIWIDQKARARPDKQLVTFDVRRAKGEQISRSE